LGNRLAHVQYRVESNDTFSREAHPDISDIFIHRLEPIGFPLAGTCSVSARMI